MNPRVAAALAIVAGLAAVAVATLLGASSGVALDTIVHPPPIVRAALVGGGAGLGVVLLVGALSRLFAGTADVPGLIRGVRLAFLAIAAFAAAAGWAVGHPLPLLVALVIAGIDVVETSFLLVVAGSDPR